MPTGWKVPKAWLESGVVKEANSFEELAAKIGVPPDELRQTAERFNELARKGHDDDFNRGDSAYDNYYGDPTLPNPNLHPLGKPPYYAFQIILGDLGTSGGLRTDEHARVLRTTTLVEGLYAVGNASAAVMGRSYAGAGATIGPAMTFGYVAAKHIARPAARRNQLAPKIRSRRSTPIGGNNEDFAVLRVRPAAAVGDDDEHELFQDGLDEVELADKAGFSTVWLTEHHFLEEYCHSTAPEMFLAAASQRTKDIRLGFGIMHLPPRGQPPGPRRRAHRDARPASPTAASSSAPASRRRWASSAASTSTPPTSATQWEEALEVSIRCMIEEPFTGFKGEHIEMPARNVIPKPLQKPHPPVWVACTRPSSVQMAAQKAIGALSFAYTGPAR